jgi:putative glutamine transport system substrate-binding protein
MAQAQSFTGTFWADAQKTKQATLTVTYTEALKFAEKKNGEYTGLCFDIWRDFEAYVASRYGITVKTNIKDLSDPRDFDLFMLSVQKSTGGVFGLADVTITEERKKIYHFSLPYFKTTNLLVTNSAVPTLSAMDKIPVEFKDKTLLVQKGTTYEARALRLKAKYPSIVLKTTVNIDEVYATISKSDQYFTFIDLSAFMSLTGQRLPIKRHSAGDEVGEEMGIIMPKTSDWAKVFNEFLQQYIGTTEYKKAISDNLGLAAMKMMESMK